MKHEEGIQRCYIPVVKPRVKKLAKVKFPTRFVGSIVCPSVWGFWTHWNPRTKRTIRCSGDKTCCPGHAEEMPLKQIGIIELYTKADQQSGFIQLTPGAWDELRVVAGGCDLRGMQIQIQRDGPGEKRPLKVDLLGWDEDPSYLPKPSDPWDTLKRIWGLD